MTTVFLVEDDLSFAVLLTRALSKSKRIKIVGAYTSGEEALRALPMLKPELILMDIKLPGMNGIECLRRLRRIFPPLLCHVLMLTEYEDSDLVFEALKAGASGYPSPWLLTCFYTGEKIEPLAGRRDALRVFLAWAAERAERQSVLDGLLSTERNTTWRRVCVFR